MSTRPSTRSAGMISVPTKKMVLEKSEHVPGICLPIAYKLRYQRKNSSSYVSHDSRCVRNSYHTIHGYTDVSCCHGYIETIGKKVKREASYNWACGIVNMCIGENDSNTKNNPSSMGAPPLNVVGSYLS